MCFVSCPHSVARVHTYQGIIYQVYMMVVHGHWTGTIHTHTHVRDGRSRQYGVDCYCRIDMAIIVCVTHGLAGIER